MHTMAPTRPTERHACRIRLTARAAAAAEARSQVSEVICAWQPPVDHDVAILLTSDLVTNAIRHATGATITLAVRCGHGQLRVDVDGATGTGSAREGIRADAQIGPGLILVATLSDEWGFYRTAAGQAVYFALAFQPGPADDGHDLG